MGLVLASLTRPETQQPRNALRNVCFSSARSAENTTAGDWLLALFALLGTVAVPVVRRGRRHM